MSPSLPDPKHYPSSTGGGGGGSSGSGGGGGRGGRGRGGGGPLDVRIAGGVSLAQRGSPDTEDQAFWSRILTSSELLSFDKYFAFLDEVFCKLQTGEPHEAEAATARAPLPFPDVHAFSTLKAATEIYMEFACGVDMTDDAWDAAFARDENRLGLDLDSSNGGDRLKALWDAYVDTENGIDEVIPYLIDVRRKNLFGVPIRDPALGVDQVELCNFLLQEKLRHPCFIELIWSYWHEEGLLVRCMEVLSRRFQNKGAGLGREPLAEFELTPLRPLNNLLWGYIQDEQHRLTPERRWYEYDHHYGLRRSGGRAAGLRPADSRSRFLNAFHLLVQKCAAFFKEDDDTTVSADAFPILNALREVHILLAEGAHNQFGDLPWTSRQEMLIEQWLLARPEFDEFLPSRKSVVFPEAWMHRVETLKRLHGWDQASVRHFNNLARYGELLLISIRYGNWAVVDSVDSARNWARFFRQELQWYMHSYQAVTGVDLAAGMLDVRQAAPPVDRAAQPSELMQQRPVRGTLVAGQVRQAVRPPAPRRQLRS